jgi:hypothetical protein
MKDENLHGLANRIRHIVRNVYTYRFDPAKVEKLVRSAPDVFTQLKAELSSLATFLEQ